MEFEGILPVQHSKHIVLYPAFSFLNLAVSSGFPTGCSTHKSGLYRDDQRCPRFTKLKKSVDAPYCWARTKKGFPCRERVSSEVGFGGKVLVCGVHSTLLYKTWQTRGVEVVRIIERWAKGAQDRYGAGGAEKGLGESERKR